MTIKAIWFDTDGVVVASEPFSKQYQKEYGVLMDEITPFFTGPFTKCSIGEADLKEELVPWLEKWQWQGTVDEFLSYWFSTEHILNKTLLDKVNKLRKKGLLCWLMGNQEAYRDAYLREEMQLPKYFDETIFSVTIRAAKPDEEFFLRIYELMREKHEIKKEEILYIDDSKKYVEIAKNLGFQAEHFTADQDFSRIEDQYQL